MPFDLGFVDAHRQVERPDVGVLELFEELPVRGARCVATIYRPLRPAAASSTGWVICHSLGLEQATLMEHEVATARALASAGMSVLRYQGRGYGDAEDVPGGVGLEGHMEDAEAAVARLAAMDGIARIGVIGGRFGGTVAALSADRLGLPLMAVWEPALSGDRFMRDLFRSDAIRRMARDLQRSRRDPDGRTAHSISDGDPDPATLLRTRGSADLGGFLLTERGHREIAAVDLRSDLRRFDGHALIVSLAAPPRPLGSSPDAAALADDLRSLGAACDETLVVDPQSGNFGRIHHGSVDDARPKRDLQAPLESKLAAITAEWCLRRATPPVETSSAATAGSRP